MELMDPARPAVPPLSPNGTQDAATRSGLAAEILGRASRDAATVTAFVRPRPLDRSAVAEDRYCQATIDNAGPAGSLAELAARYRRSPKFTQRAAKTRLGYRTMLDHIEAEAGHLQVADITLPWLVRFYKIAQYERGRSMANAFMRVWGILFNFGRAAGLAAANPLYRFPLEHVAPRMISWTPEQVEALCATAARHGRESIALAVRLTLDIGRRQGDLLALRWADYNEGTISCLQKKTGAVLALPVSRELQQILNALPHQTAFMIGNEATGRPYSLYHFRHEFARLRDLAGLPKALQFRDLRAGAAAEMADDDDAAFSSRFHRHAALCRDRSPARQNSGATDRQVAPASSDTHRKQLSR